MFFHTIVCKYLSPVTKVCLLTFVFYCITRVKQGGCKFKIEALTAFISGLASNRLSTLQWHDSFFAPP